MYDRDERAYIWLCTRVAAEYRKKVELLSSAPSPAALFESPSEFFGGLPYEKDRAKREDDLEKFLAETEKKGYFLITLLSGDYPEHLKHIPAPPLLLYGRGRRELLKGRLFCAVGSRITPPWAEKLGSAIAGQLAESFVLVTGLAEGGDSAVISGALPSGNLISVLPCGLDDCYPASHASLKERIAEKGLLLSEAAPAEGARKYSFYARNRILAGISEGVFVLSAAQKSGALITANYALDFGRDVFAFPHNVGSAQGAGCNDLIKKGAYLVTEAADILSYYGFSSAGRKTEDLTPSEKQVMEILREYGELHTAVIAEKVGMSAFEASAVLSALEIKGFAVKSGGNRFAPL